MRISKNLQAYVVPRQIYYNVLENYLAAKEKYKKRSLKILFLNAKTTFTKEGFSPFLVKSLNLLIKGVVFLMIYPFLRGRTLDTSINFQYQFWFKKNYPNSLEITKQSEEIIYLENKPKISIITPVFNTKEKFLKECIDSVINQSYQNWEMCIVDDASREESLREIIKSYALKDKRIKYKFRKTNGHISKASNDALALATGDYVGLLDHDDVLWPSALYEVVKVFNSNPAVEFIYSDEEKIDESSNNHMDPFFKPDWSPSYLRTVNYITHFTIVKKTIIDKIGGFKEGLEGAQDWDLILRATREIEKNKSFNQIFNGKKKIYHIPKILYSWRKSSTSTASEKNTGRVKSYSLLSQKVLLENDLKERGYKGSVERISESGYYQVKYQVIGNPKVSIIIPTKDKYNYISKCLTSILKLTTYKNYEIVIVDTGSVYKNVFDLYKYVSSKHNQTKVLTWNKEFNFSAVCNFGAKQSNGGFLLFLNNDTEVISPDWIEGLLQHAQRKEIGAVGCKLLYTNNTIQHAGIILGITGGGLKKGVAGHAYRHFPESFNSFAMVGGVREYSAVTAACLMIEKQKYLEVGGQDPQFKIAFNDVDLNLKLLKKGYYNLYVGSVSLFHFESISVKKPGSKHRSPELFRQEIKRIQNKWGYLLEKDPFYNKNLTLEKEDFGLKANYLKDNIKQLDI